MSDSPQAGEFCWNELATPNVKAAKEFYGKVFDWEFTEHDMGDMTYSMIKRKDKKEFAGIVAIPKDKLKEIPPHWLNYILVENIDQSVEKAQKHGATLIRPTANAGDFGRFAILKDPTGAAIALWQPLQRT